MTKTDPARISTDTYHHATSPLVFAEKRIRTTGVGAMRKGLNFQVGGTLLLLMVLVGAVLAATAASALPIATPSAIEPPQRVLLLGDSLSASITPALEERFAAESIEFVYTGFPGTGPLTFQGTFWREALAENIAQLDPDLVIIQASGNYNIGDADPFIKPDGSVLQHGTDEFFEVWDDHVQQLVAQAEASGADTKLVTAPVVAGAASSHPVSRDHNLGYRHLVSITGAELLDWNRLLAPDGIYRATISVDGVERPLRDVDGLHFAEVSFPVVADWLVEEVCTPGAGAGVLAA